MTRQKIQLDFLEKYFKILAMDKPTPKLTPKGEERRKTILRSAIILFGRHGHDGVTAREIARHAGVPQSLLNYYWSGKGGASDLYKAAYLEAVAMTTRRLGLLPEPPKVDDPRAVEKAVDGVYQAVLLTLEASMDEADPAEREAFALSFREYRDPQPEILAEMLNGINTPASYLREYLRVLRPDLSREALSMAASAFWGMTHYPRLAAGMLRGFRGRDYPIEWVAIFVTRLIVRGLAEPDGPVRFADRPDIFVLPGFGDVEGRVLPRRLRKVRPQAPAEPVEEFPLASWAETPFEAAPEHRVVTVSFHLGAFWCGPEALRHLAMEALTPLGAELLVFHVGGGHVFARVGYPDTTDEATARDLLTQALADPTPIST